MIRFAMLSALLTLLFHLPAQAQDKLHPIAVKVKESLKDPAKPFAMAVILQAKPGTEAQLEAAFVKAIQATRKEKGCSTYDLNRDLQKPGQYVLYERWQDLPALNAHLHTPHITKLLADLADLFAAPPEIRVMLPAAE